MRALRLIPLLLASVAIDAAGATTLDEPLLVFDWSARAEARADRELAQRSSRSMLERACRKRLPAPHERLVFDPANSQCFRWADVMPEARSALSKALARSSSRSPGGSRAEDPLWVWADAAEIRSKGPVCACETTPVPVLGLTAGGNQSLRERDQIDPISFKAINAVDGTLAEAFEWRRDRGSWSDGLPGSLSHSCTEDRASCTITGPAPEPPGAYELRLKMTNQANGISSQTTVSLGVTPGPAGAISGRLMRESDGTPVVGALMLLFRTDQGSLEAGAVETDSDGRFTFAGLDAAAYTVGTFSMRGFGLLDEFWDDVDCALGCNPSIGTPIVVADDEAVIGIDIAVATAGSITGNVRRADDARPIGEMAVNIFVVNPNGTLSGAGLGFTDALGNYTISGLPTGTYKVGLEQLFDFQVTNNEGLTPEVWNDIPCPCLFADGDDIAVTQGLPTTGIDFVLETAPNIVSGTVTDALTNLPIEGVELQIQDVDIAVIDEPRIRIAGKILTDSAGRYEFRVKDGNYVVQTIAQDYVDEWFDDLPVSSTIFESIPPIVIGGNNRTDIDFALDPGSAIEGQVLRAAGGSPVSPLLVVANKRDDGQLFASITNSDGRYSISGLPTGDYRVAVGSAAEFNLVPQVFDGVNCSPCDGVEGTPVTVTFGQATSGINFVLDAGGGIAGRVTEAATGNNLPGVLMFIFDDQGRTISQEFVDVTGRYVIQGLPPGSYFVQSTRAGSFSLVNEIFDDLPCVGACDPLTGSPVNVTVGTLTDGIDFALAAVPVLAGNAPADLDALGDAVAVDGDLLAIGVPGDDEQGEDAGAVLLYRLVDGAYVLEAKVFADDPTPGARFGSSVAIENGVVVAGAPGTPPAKSLIELGKGAPAVSAAAYVLRVAADGSVDQLQRLAPANLTNPSSARFGTSVAIANGVIAVGAPAGQKAASDGAGAPSGAASGAVLTYEAQAGSFVAGAVLNDPAGVAGDAFGTAVAASATGVAVGAPNKQTTAIGAGVASLFDRVAANLWTDPVNASGTGAGDGFGASIALDGTTMVVGSPGDDTAAENAGAAYVFDFDGATLVRQAQIVPVDPNTEELLGAVDGRFGAALSLRGRAMAIGADGESGETQNTGAAYVFTRESASESATWQLGDRLVRTGGESDDLLGRAVAVGPGAVVVGAPGADNDGVAAGVVLGAASDRERIFASGFEVVGSE